MASVYMQFCYRWVTGQLHLRIFDTIYLCFCKQISTLNPLPGKWNGRNEKNGFKQPAFYSRDQHGFSLLSFFLSVKHSSCWHSTYGRKKFWAGLWPDSHHHWGWAIYTVASNHQVKWLCKSPTSTFINDDKCKALEHRILCTFSHILGFTFWHIQYNFPIFLGSGHVCI